MPVPKVPRTELLRFVINYFLASVYKYRKSQLCFITLPTLWHYYIYTIKQQKLSQRKEKTDENQQKSTLNTLTSTAFWGEMRVEETSL